VVAQEEEKPAAKAAPAAAEEVEIPEERRPKDVPGNELITSDGVSLQASFFPGDKGKDTVPVILLHSWKGERRQYASLAHDLWLAGHAVLVPDLRGHGQSTVQYVGSEQRTLDASKFVAADFAAMVTSDMEALKRFLRRQNNAGKLNLEKLCVVGAEMGASVALNWAVLDWSWQNYPGVKQGQSVKALVLLTPQRNLRGMNISQTLQNPILSQLSIMVLVGNEEPKVLKDVQGIHAILERSHPAPAEGRERTDQTLFFKGLDTKVQGTRLLDEPGLNVQQRIAKFIDLRLVTKDYPWMESGKKAPAAPAK
jgi:pimeloyl-ACP methyl ester carboxylesterase